MTPDAVAVLAQIQASGVEVRLPDGQLFGCVPLSAAAELVGRGLASPVGRNAVKYLVLNCDVPGPARPWYGGSRTTFVEKIPMSTGFSFITQHKSARL
jgi:hypothetical protein